MITWRGAVKGALKISSCVLLHNHVVAGDPILLETRGVLTGGEARLSEVAQLYETGQPSMRMSAVMLNTKNKHEIDCCSWTAALTRQFSLVPPVVFATSFMACKAAKACEPDIKVSPKFNWTFYYSAACTALLLL